MTEREEISCDYGPWWESAVERTPTEAHEKKGAHLIWKVQL